jgi:hypothetical protein
MKIGEAFGDYMKAADLDRPVMFVMSHVEMRDVGDDHKPVLFFVGQPKGLVVNRTNATTITEAYGDDTDAWEGKQIVLFVDQNVFYAGKKTPAIRVRKPKTTANPAPKVREAPPPDDMDDDIPFD